MPTCRRARISFLLGAVGILAAAVPASAVENKVLLGEVTTRASDASASVRATFRGIVESEVAALRLGDAGGSDRFVLSASLLRMRIRSDRGQARASCVVSAALRREKGGTLL